jgi:hypothetical protein
VGMQDRCHVISGYGGWGRIDSKQEWGMAPLFAYFTRWYAIVVGSVNSCYGARKMGLGDDSPQ